MMSNRRVVLFLLALGTAGPVSAQEIAGRLVATERGRFAIPLCPLRTNGKVGDAQKELKKGIEEEDAAKRSEALDKARANAVEALGVPESAHAGAWYFLARTYLAQGDVRGADSAFTRALALQPDCEIDIDQYRQNAWAVLANAGIEKQQAGDSDSALALFRQATTMFRGLPHVFENMGIMFANSGATDSAAVYFAHAVETAMNDSTLVDNRNSSTMNLALMQQRLGRHGDAIRTLHQYLEWNPGDTDARRSLAYSFREAGQTDSAEVVEQALVSEFSAMNLDSLSFQDLMAVGVSQFNAGQYQEAVRVFNSLMSRNPWSRDAVYNLANAHLALENWTELVGAGKRLLEIEPMNEDAYRLLGSAYRGLEQQDSLIRVAERMVGLPVRIEMSGFSMGASSSRIEGVATGRDARDPSGAPIAPAPVTVVVEFLDAQGAVVASSEIEIPVLAEDGQAPIRAEVRGEGITSWRYRKK